VSDVVRGYPAIDGENDRWRIHLAIGPDNSNKQEVFEKPGDSLAPGFQMIMGIVLRMPDEPFAGGRTGRRRSSAAPRFRS
jgi:hypothetical protein